MIEIIITLILGVFIGTITGIIPGLHVNTVGIIIFSISTTLLKYTTPLCLCTFFVSLAICHAMMEFLPSLLIGVPNEDTILSIQPAHKLLLKGKSRKVIRLVSFGGYSSIIILILIMPILFVILPPIYYGLKNYIGYLLIIVMSIMIYKSNKNNITRMMSLLIFLISGILGIIILSSYLGSNMGLLCMLSGLFSISTLLYSVNNESSIPPQNNDKSIVVNSDFKKSVFAGSISGCILGLLPGLGPAQGTLIAQTLLFKKNITPEDFLITNSGINISDTLFSLMAIYLINNPRSAISVYVNDLIQNITLNHILFFIFVSLMSASLSCILAIKIGDRLIDNISKFNYRKLNIVIIFLITGIILIYCIVNHGCLWYIFLCYITSIALGILVNVLDLSKSNLMGVLIVPSILMYLGIL
ncbi:MAG: tripartite tricarboxylate transporter permease [Methanosphaera sp.]